ncbi:hypothetical protein SUDANB66_01402 [Streptomyces sp. SudanB66_2053]
MTRVLVVEDDPQLVRALGKTNYLRVHMAQLRRRLEKDPSHPRYLITEPGMGHRFEG